MRLREGGEGDAGAGGLGDEKRGGGDDGHGDDENTRVQSNFGTKENATDKEGAGQPTTARTIAPQPGVVVVVVPPFIPLLLYALLSSAMSFFLFSFQVHEKTILLPLLPLTLIASGAQPGTALHSWGVLGNNVAVFRCVRLVWNTMFFLV